MTDKRPTLPPLNALRAFDALARCGSLRAAANDLGVVPGAVRQQLSSLEEHFGVPLFNRDGGRVSLNDTSRRLADAVGVAFAIIARAADEVTPQGQRSKLRVGVPMPMAAAWFIPRLPRILADVKSLEIQVVPVPVSLSLTDAADIDALIAGGEYRPLPDISATQFMNDEFGPVGSPEAIAQLGPGLDAGTAIIARDVSYLWDDWFRESGTTPVRFQRRTEFNDLMLAISAAKAGLGLTIAPRASIEADLAAGTLIAPFGFCARPAGYRLCCRAVDRDRKAIVALRAWLVAEGKAANLHVATL
ncbi:LysR substrate-binding domain-containing protein [Rhizobium sp. S96]|uniref:LysR substrate-binding domain-containing protein n=1 Tax=Rhizobium sp. S96 TaxID=3055140 RepID=UPI0025AB41B3|nr:LysR substrate-binding domain-containing protein [Rhizobium sp. S96]MDM9624200.1 LysR substrate-binding domain-containing protein [Rhizobium sp. S96]